MKSSVQKIGNSAGAIIPSHMLKKHNLKVGERINITEEGNRIIIEPSSDKQKYTLAELLKQCDSSADMPKALEIWNESERVGNELL